jgi:hypothetical protein
VHYILIRAVPLDSRRVNERIEDNRRNPVDEPLFGLIDSDFTVESLIELSWSTFVQRPLNIVGHLDCMSVRNFILSSLFMREESLILLPFVVWG